MMRGENKVFCWNYRGARSKELVRQMREYINLHNPVIVILMELRINGEMADSICKRLGKRCWIRSDLEGLSGGIWCLWNDDKITVELRYAHPNFLHLAVSSSKGRSWELTAIYTQPHASRRSCLWGKLDELRVEGPWVLMGDFNCVLHNEERSLGRGVSTSFQTWTEKKGLIDLGYEGVAFTWSHGVSKIIRRAARLDRIMCDDV